MPDKKPPDYYSHHISATDALHEGARSAVVRSRVLQRLADHIASNELDNLDIMEDESTRALVGANVASLVKILLQRQAERIKRMDAPRRSENPEILYGRQVTRSIEELCGSRNVFISYSLSDQFIASALKKDIEAAKLNCFLSQESNKPGDPWQRRIWHAIRNCRVFVPLLSVDYMKREWCLYEIGFAKGLNKELIPAIIPSPRNRRLKMPNLLDVHALELRSADDQKILVRRIIDRCN
jgi:hypothetical protein